MQNLEKILEEIENERTDIDDYSDAKSRMLARYWNSCIDVVEDIIRKHMNDGWIPTEERLPEDEEEILAQWEFYSRYDNMTYTYIQIMRPNKITGGWNGIYGVPNGKVIAWQPLPELYHPEEIEKRSK